MSSRIAIKSNPTLWNHVKQQVMKSSKGGLPGKWSARKAQIAVRLYKSRGGKYKGSRTSQNSLTKWSREKWDYISNKRSGRYLPLVVRKHLSSRSRKSENRRKGSKRGKWVPYGSEVSRLMRKHKIV